MKINVPKEYMEDKEQEFRRSRAEEQMGMNDANRTHRNDYLAPGMQQPMDSYQLGEFEPSWATQLDTTGMQPHSREYLERDIMGIRSTRKFKMVDGQAIDYCDGIHFDGMP